MSTPYDAEWLEWDDDTRPSTDTRGLSRKEHLITKIEAGEALNEEERAWAIELLRLDELEQVRRA